LVAGVGGTISSTPGVISIGAWRSADGVHDRLREVKVSDDRDLPVIAALAPGRPVRPFARILAETGAAVSWVDDSADRLPQVGFRVPGERMGAVAAVLDATRGLVWAEAQAPIRLLNSESVWRCQSGRVDQTPIFDHGLFGENQVIGIMDTGLDVDECRFNDPGSGLPAINDADGIEVDPRHRKVLAVDFHWDADQPPGPSSWDDQGHGTHVAGSAAGDVRGNGVHDAVDGMAPAAKLVIQDGGAWLDDCADLPGLGCPVKPLEPVLEQARAQGARIHTNSWGDEENILPFGRYTERTADVDRFVWRRKDTLVLFAAGNSGAGSDTVISPATGKNVVAVGASLHGDFEPPCVAAFSSRGWTADGRIKPDVVAPGVGVISAATNGEVPGQSCGNTEKSGTSMAAPTAAGLAALVRQYFTDGFHPSGVARPADVFEPSAALIKAVLIASAVDLSTMGCPDDPIPSRDQGWGLIQLDTALAFAGDNHRLLVDDHSEGFASPGDEPVRAQVALTENGPLKVVLVWTDAPSSSLADDNLLNDLDLTVEGPDGEYYGNIFIDGASVTGGLHDRTNNVEVVWLPSAGKGVWTIEVSPHAVPAPDQDFALVMTGPVRPEEGPRSPSTRVVP
jgi:subtilisin family serine protease